MSIFCISRKASRCRRHLPSVFRRISGPFGDDFSTLRHQGSQSWSGALHRCFASRVKDMNSKQLAEATEHAYAGKGGSIQGHLKKAGDDHQNSVQDSIVQQATEKMESVVQKLRQHLSKRGVQAARDSTTVEDWESKQKDLSQEAEKGRRDVRAVRQRLMQQIGRLERDGELSSDEQHRFAEQVQGVTDKHIAEVDAVLRSAKDT